MDSGIRFPEHIFTRIMRSATRCFYRHIIMNISRRSCIFITSMKRPRCIPSAGERCEDRMAAGRGILENAKKFGYLETYRPEICFEYTMLFYVNTLFSYMVGKGHKSLSFIRKMGNELKEAFPDFADNPYYQERVNAEQKKMIAMQQRSTSSVCIVL